MEKDNKDLRPLSEEQLKGFDGINLVLSGVRETMCQLSKSINLPDVGSIVRNNLFKCSIISDEAKSKTKYPRIFDYRKHHQELTDFLNSEEYSNYLYNLFHGDEAQSQQVEEPKKPDEVQAGQSKRKGRGNICVLSCFKDVSKYDDVINKAKKINDEKELIRYFTELINKNVLLDYPTIGGLKDVGIIVSNGYKRNTSYRRKNLIK